MAYLPAHYVRRAVSTAPSTTISVPLFLAPALQISSANQTPIQAKSAQQHHRHHHRPQNRLQARDFSANCQLQARSAHRYGGKDKNKARGVSAIRRTGPRTPLSVSKYPLPTPVDDPPARKEFKTLDDHGLWGFFDKSKRPLTTPEELAEHGRAWTYAELVNKNWFDLWELWWRCVRERNWLATEAIERKRVEAGWGDYEGEERDEVVSGNNFVHQYA